MVRIIVIAVLIPLFTITFSALAKYETSEYYGSGLCDKPGFKCITVQRGQTWRSLFPNEHQRDLVQRLNRMDTYLAPGKTLAVPTDLEDATIFSISPFPLKIKRTGEKLVIVNQDQLAWGAYDAQGQLLNWGPISSGKNFCYDIYDTCKTVTGTFYMFSKQGPECISRAFPVATKGGSPMPYCMYFYKGYALHGSHQVMGYRDSHGCVRIFSKDAEWLNRHFVGIGNQHKGLLGTKVVVQKLTIGDK